MADNLTTQSATLATVPASSVISTEEVTTLNGGAVSAQHVQRVLPSLRTADGTAVDVTTANPLPVSDAGGSLTVDGTVAATQSGTWNVTNVSGTVSLPTGAATSAKQDTQITAEQGIQTAVELIDDAVKADDAAFTPGTTKVLMAGFEYDDTTPDSVDEGDAGAARMSARREVYTQLRDAAGNERGANVNASNELLVALSSVPSHAVTNAGTFAVQVSSAIPAGTNNIGDVDILSIAAGDNNIGNVDIASIAAGTNYIGKVRLTDGTNDAALLNLTNSKPVPVGIVDGNGDQITSFGGGTQYTEDAAAAANPVGTVPMLVRKDTPASEVSADGDNIAQRGSAYGASYVTLVDNAGSFVSVGGGTQYDEDAAHSTGSKVTGCGIVRKDTAASLAGTDGDYTLPIADANGKLWVNASGVTLTVDGSGVTQPVSHAALTELAAAIDTEVQCDIVGALPAGNNNIGDVDVASVVPGTGATNLGKAEDAAHASGDVGVMALTVRQDSAAALAGTDADYQPLISDSSGRLHVNVGNTVTVGSHAVTNAGTFAVQVDAALPAGTNAIGKLAANSGVDIGDVDVTSIAAGTNLIGDVGIQPRASNGLSTMNATSSDGATALTNSAQAIKASAGLLYGWAIYNPNAAAAFVQFYNTAAASVTVGTTNPLFMLTIPPLAAAQVVNPLGITFSNAGWSWAATSTAGGNGALSSALDAVAFYA